MLKEYFSTHPLGTYKIQFSLTESSKLLSNKSGASMASIVIVEIEWHSLKALGCMLLVRGPIHSAVMPEHP